MCSVWEEKGAPVPSLSFYDKLFGAKALRRVSNLIAVLEKFFAEGGGLMFGVPSNPDVFIDSQANSTYFLLDEGGKRTLKAFLEPKACASGICREVCRFLDARRRQKGCMTSKGMALQVLPVGSLCP
jgi:hypothetical protein